MIETNEIICVLNELEKAGYLTKLEVDSLISQMEHNEELPHTCVEGRSVYLSNMTLYQSHISAYLLTLDEELEALISIMHGNDYTVRLNGDAILSGKL